MTVFLVDLSHYDGAVSQTEIASWLPLGVVGVTHKIGEGLANDDPLDGTVLARARAVGMPVLGGYFIPHQGVDPVAEARRCVALADRDEGWWRTFPYWFWQIDAERWSGTDRVTKAEIKAFSDALVRVSGVSRMRVCYASRGQYGDTLAGLGLPLWNAHYGANHALPFRAAYAGWGGDHGPGWIGYSGVPADRIAFCQFGSATTVGRTTTTDCSAYRGTLEQLKALIRPDLKGTDMSITPDEIKAIATASAAAVHNQILGHGPTTIGQALAAIGGLQTSVVNLGKLVAAFGTGMVSGSPDAAALAAALRAAADRLAPPSGSTG